MKYSNVALYIYAMREMKIFTTNKSFHSKFKTIDDLRAYVIKDKKLINYVEILKKRIEADDSIDGFISLFDEEFPQLNKSVTKSDTPVLLFYKGDISLIKNISHNVAVIGSRNVDENIVNREAKLVKYLISKNCVIVSGLAKGCDTVAHNTAINENGKTIAILSTKLDEIYPASNKLLADKCSLLLSEYNDSDKSKFKERLIARDRLQAMFSTAVIACAGSVKSGTRHAMAKAKSYNISSFVMYNETSDVNNSNFGLAKSLLASNDTKIANITNLTKHLNPINYCSDDIFNMDVDAIVNPINCVGAMGKGLALAFKNKYPDNFSNYKKMCNDKKVVIGKMLIYKEAGVEIINFPTKNHWRDKSELEYIEKGLDDLVKVLQEGNIKSIAIPALGAGLGGLEWEVVKDTINKKLSNTAKYVRIYVIEPK